MNGRFDRFILLAEMRTGSNFLEENLNSIDGLRCWGEAFNPHFTGKAGNKVLAGVEIADRERDPNLLLEAMAEGTTGLSGFRFFHDHDRRVIDRLLPDPSCAKIVLTRNPLDSYVSLKIARETNQWRLNDMKGAKSARITFDEGEFRDHVARLQAFQLGIQRGLQTTGQTAFYLAYEDVGEVQVLNGLAAWLGVPGRIGRIEQATKVQNPGELSDKVLNYDQMVGALADFDHFDLNRTPVFEPRRGPQVRGYIAAERAPVMFMPMAGGPLLSVERWLTALTGGGALLHAETQKDIRRWMRGHGGHRSFTMLRHPVARLHETFCRHILMPGPDCFSEIRDTLRTHYNVPLPPGKPGADYGVAAHRAAFMAFADFVNGNLNGQTSLRVDPNWASQGSLLQGMAQFLLPDRILREDEASAGLADLSRTLGLESPVWQMEEPQGPVGLDRIYDKGVEERVRGIYRRDYLTLGFDAWR